MQGATSRCGRVFALSVCVLFSRRGIWFRLRAQQAVAATTLAGTVLGLTRLGKGIPSATVTVKNDAVAATTQTVTADSEGHFSAAGLPAGTYTIEATAQGFGRKSRTGIQLSAGKPEDVSITLSVEALAQAVTVQESVSLAEQLAPSGNTLDATSAKTEISGEFIKNFISPMADFAEVVNLAPGTFSLNPNGIGLGQGKIYYRGFQDGQFTMTFDGIPFEDTNSPTHHSWANFPAQWLGSTDFDRSPGQASTFGPTNFGGSINLLSPGRYNQAMDIRLGDRGLWLLGTRAPASTRRRLRAAFGPGSRKAACCSTFTRCCRTGIRPLTIRSASQARVSINTGSQTRRP